MRDVDLTKIHYLTGPFEIEGAAPGDLLLVEIMDVQPFEDHPVRGLTDNFVFWRKMICASLPTTLVLPSGLTLASLR